MSRETEEIKRLSAAKKRFVVLLNLQKLEFERMKNKETLPQRQMELRINAKKRAAQNPKLAQNKKNKNKKLCPAQAQFGKIASRDFIADLL